MPELDRTAPGVGIERRLTALVGPDHVLTEAGQRAGHEIDWTRRFRGEARAVVRPAATGEVAGYRMVSLTVMNPSCPSRVIEKKASVMSNRFLSQTPSRFPVPLTAADASPETSASP